MTLDSADGVALQLLLVPETFVGDTLLAVRAFLPLLLLALVAADMDVFRGEKVHDFIEHTLQEGEGTLLAGTIDVLADQPFAGDLIALSPAAEPWIGGQGGRGVSRNLDLGNDGNMALSGIFDDFAGLLLGVESVHRHPVGNPAVGVPSRPRHRVGAVIAHPGEFGILLDLNPPALIVGKMPVEGVDLVHRQQVEDGLDLIHRPEMAAAVEHHPAVIERRSIFDVHAGQRAGAQLRECLPRIEHAGLTSRADPDPLAVDVQDVCLAFQRRRKGHLGRLRP